MLKVDENDMIGINALFMAALARELGIHYGVGNTELLMTYWTLGVCVQCETSRLSAERSPPTT